MKHSIRSLLCRLCALLLLAAVMPMSASAYTLSDMCWTQKKVNGLDTLYLDGMWRLPEDGVLDLDISQVNGTFVSTSDVIIFGNNYYSRGDLARMSKVQNLYLGITKALKIQDLYSFIAWFKILHFSGDFETLPLEQLKQKRTDFWFLDGGMDINGSIGYIADDAFCTYGYSSYNSYTYRCFRVLSVNNNYKYSTVNGILARNETGMPLWAPDEAIFKEGPYVYMYGQDKQSVMLWYVKSDELKKTAILVLPDATESGLPIRWISAQAMEVLSTSPASDMAQAVAKQQSKVDSAQAQLDRWITGGKNTEKEIQKQRDKVGKEQGKLDELLAQQASIDAAPHEVYLGRYVEAVSDFSGFELDIDMLYIPAGLTHKGEGLNQWTGEISIYFSVN